MKRKLINTIKEILFILFKLKNRLYDFFKQSNYYMSIAIVSCDKWKGKVKEDWLIKHELNKLNVRVEIISWQDKNIDLTKFDSLLIKSIWGFQHNKKEFDSWLENIKNKKIKIFNDVEIIKKNYDKEIQFNLLKDNYIDTIQTYFIEVDNNLIKNVVDIKKKYLKENDLIVIKPTISESGNDTYIVGNTTKKYKNNIKVNEVYDKFYLNNNRKLMVQPFIEEIVDGEYNVCCINGKITHAVLRMSNVFENKNIVKYIPLENIPKNMIDITNKVLNISEYANGIYMRVDIIKHRDRYLIMEVEMLDPNLFLNFISDKKVKQKVIHELAKTIVEKTKITNNNL